MNDYGMFDENLDRSLGFLLNDVSRQLRNRFATGKRGRLADACAMARDDVSAPPRRRTTKRMAALLEVENVTLGRHIDRLEESGWVERRSDPADRRLGSCTSRTSRCQSWTNSRLFSLKPGDRIDGLSAQERDDLIETLLRIKVNLAEADEEIRLRPNNRKPR